MAGQHRFAIGNTWGRPRIYENEDELAAKVMEYFEWCKGEFKEVEVVKTVRGKETVSKVKETIRPAESYTITGLCLFLGFESRSTFDKQAERSAEFSYIVKRAKMIIEQRYEAALDGDSVAGPIFALKNMGWKDKVEHGGDMTMGLIWNEEKTYDKDEAEQKANQGA